MGPTRPLSVAEQVAALLASGEAWSDGAWSGEAAVVPAPRSSTEATVGVRNSPVDRPPPVTAAVVELGFRDGTCVRLDPYALDARDLLRVAQALLRHRV